MCFPTRRLALGAILCAFLTAPAIMVAASSAAQPSDATNSDAEAAVRAASKAYIDALARGDAEAIASMWTDDGVYVDATGQSHAAREMARHEFGAPSDGAPPAESQTPPTKTPQTSQVESTIRFLKHDVALEEGTVAPRSGASGGLRFAAVWVFEDDRWLLDHLREYALAANAQPSPLAELSWFIGDWTAQGGDLDATLSAHWSDDGKFLIKQFTIRRPGQSEVKGTQRIAWDPADEVIRSWSFLSDGGFVEGEWQHEGDAWVVTTAGVAPSGERTASIILWVPEGPDKIWFKLQRGTVADSETNQLIVEFRRVKTAQ